MAKPIDHHEFGRQEHATEIGSDRSFGLVFTAAFLLLAAYNAWHGGRYWPAFVVVALVFLGFAWLKPAALNRLNRLWAKLGLLLGMIVSPIILSALFFLVITPFGVLRRLMGADPLRLRRDPQSDSYWIQREPPGPSGDSMREQF